MMHNKSPAALKQQINGSKNGISSGETEMFGKGGIKAEMSGKSGSAAISHWAS